MTKVYEEVLEIGSPEDYEAEQLPVHKSGEKAGDELLGDLNPRYFEEQISLKKAQLKVYSSHYIVSGNFNIFNSY